MATDLLKIKKYEFSDGTILHVRIDYANNQVALVSKEGAVQPSTLGKEDKWKAAKFVFSGRELKYMNGWLNIMACMQYAIREARDDLAAYQEAQKEKKTKQIIDIMLALNEPKGEN